TGEIDYVTRQKCDPQASTYGVGGQISCKVLAPQPRPGKLLEHTVPKQMKKTAVLVGDPQAPVSVLGNGKDGSSGNATDGNEPVILQVTEPLQRGDPDSAVGVLKEGRNPIVRQSTGGDLPHSTPGLPAPLAVNRKFAAVPSGQASRSAYPHASIP